MSPQNISAKRVAQELTSSKYPPFTDGAPLSASSTTQSGGGQPVPSQRPSAASRSDGMLEPRERQKGGRGCPAGNAPQGKRSWRTLGPSPRRRTHRRCRISSGSPPCCPRSRWPCTSRTRMGRSAVGERAVLVLKRCGGDPGSDWIPTPTFTPSGSAPLTLLGSGIPEGAPRGDGRLSVRRTPGTWGPGSGRRLRSVPHPQWSQARLPRPQPASSPPAGLTSGKDPWLYTMSSELLPQPPSPTTTIFSCFLPGPGAAVGAGAPGLSIAGSRQHWRRRPEESAKVERSGAGGARAGP